MRCNVMYSCFGTSTYKLHILHYNYSKMISSRIETQRFFRKNSVELFNNKFVVAKKSPFEFSEFELSYEQIENKKTIETKVNFGLLTIASFAGIVGFLYLFGNASEMSLVFFSITFFLILIAFVTQKKIVIIKSVTGQNIELYFTEKNKNEVVEFAEKIIDSANAYLLAKYSRLDKDLPIDNQLHNLIFLRDRELLSEERFELLKNQLLGKENKSSIGYR